MIYYQCKCGKRVSVGSMPPAPCKGCEKCNTTLASHPDFHKTPEPHEWETRYDQETGAPIQECRRCFERQEPGVPYAELKRQHELARAVAVAESNLRDHIGKCDICQDGEFCDDGMKLQDAVCEAAIAWEKENKPTAGAGEGGGKES